MRHLDLNLLITFKAIAECHSLTLAAQRVNKTQAAISIQLKKLEALTGCKLIERSYHKAELTPDGEVLLQYARRLLNLSDEAINALNPEEVRGTVRFGIPDDYASLILKEAVQAFASRYPGIRLEIRNDISHNLFKGLENGDLDIALVTRRETDTGGEMLRRDPLVWVADKHFSIPQGPLPLVLYPHGCGFRKNILDALSSSQQDYYIAFECTGVTGVKIAVDSGLAITATSPGLIQPNWRIISQDEYALPRLDAIVIELRHGKAEPDTAVKYFTDNIRERLCDV
mgnify:CR=1 FL=1